MSYWGNTSINYAHPDLLESKHSAFLEPSFCFLIYYPRCFSGNLSNSLVSWMPAKFIRTWVCPSAPVAMKPLWWWSERAWCIKIIIIYIYIYIYICIYILFYKFVLGLIMLLLSKEIKKIFFYTTKLPSPSHIDLTWFNFGSTIVFVTDFYLMRFFILK